MSWQLASFAILAAVLIGGFAWYERSRPPAQVVALVAALAALAIASRIAFAAFPNMKPTTDIVVFSGVALGAAPGFAVGALTALVSNFWFGQGPWTPWQMAGWGLCGVLGALLGLSRREHGRITLAAVCALAAVGYGALLNFSLMATYGGDLSLERFGVLLGRAIPFDVAHLVANVGFALLAGPAMVRMLVRFRRRFEWRRRHAPATPPPRLGRAGALPLSLVAVAVLLLGAAAAPARAAGVEDAADWLASVQSPDGGWASSPEREAGVEMTAWTMLGLAAAGRNPLDVERGGRNPVQFLRANADELKSASDLARTIVALQSAGVDPRDFAGRNLVAELLAKRRKDGSYEGWPNTTAIAAIALRAAGAEGSLPKTIEWLRETQNEDGGWGDVPGSPSTADGTGTVLMVLSSGSKPSQRGLEYLRRHQRRGGGFALGVSGVVNAQSTSRAVMGIVAAGGDPASFRRGGASALDYLASLQQPDGSYRYSGASDQTPIWVTAEAVMAAAGAYLPIPPPPRAPKPKPRKKPAPQGSSSSPAQPQPVVPGLSGSPPGSGGSSGSGSGSGSGGGSGAGSGSGRAPLPGSEEPLPQTLDPFGEAPPGTEAPIPPAGEEPEDSLPADATPTSAEASTADERSPAGALFLGAVAGGLVFAAGFGVRRGWMRWRYGL